MRIVDMLHGWQLFLWLFLIGGSALPAVLLPVLYATLSRFWEDAFGRFAFYQSAVIGLAMGHSAVRIFLPPAPAWVSIVIYILVFVMIWWSLILYVRTYIRARRKRREDRQREEEKKGKEDRHVQAN